jgi:hypothetical protein
MDDTKPQITPTTTDTDTEGHNTMALQIGWDPIGERRRQAEQAARDREAREGPTEKRSLLERLWAALTKPGTQH